MKRYGKISAITGLVAFMVSCTYFKNEIYIPPVAEEKASLEAGYVSTPPNSLNSSYWITADYVKVVAEDIVKEQVASDDGLLNVNGMYNGLTQFNQGQSANLELRAAYDNENLYILATWKDNTLNASMGNWLYNGPGDPLKDDDPASWTSQRGDDDFLLSFELSSSVSDLWKWSLALSEPMGHAIDMVVSNQVEDFDSGDRMFLRNTSGTDPFRSGPQFEWSGEQQEPARELANLTVLDPAYFLLNKAEFTGDIINGDARYQQRCGFCHGDNGEGGGYFYPSAPALDEPGKYARLTDVALNNSLSDDSVHQGAFYWRKLTDPEKKDVGARLRSFGGFPGYYLQIPSGSSSDVKAISNVNLAKISSGSNTAGYKVLLTRKLQTNNDDDIQFMISQTRDYVFDVYLSDNDINNRIGKTDLHLTFK